MTPEYRGRVGASIPTEVTEGQGFTIRQRRGQRVQRLKPSKSDSLAVSLKRYPDTKPTVLFRSEARNLLLVCTIDAAGDSRFLAASPVGMTKAALLESCYADSHHNPLIAMMSGIFEP